MIAGVTAATGVASTATAISTFHRAATTNATLASIGGGALSAGGGGMTAGQAVLTCINTGAGYEGRKLRVAFQAHVQRSREIKNIPVKSPIKKTDVICELFSK